MSPARLKTLEAIAKIRDKENKILSTSFIILEWSLQRQKYETDVSNGGRFLRDVDHTLLPQHHVNRINYATYTMHYVTDL